MNANNHENATSRGVFTDEVLTGLCHRILLTAVSHVNSLPVSEQAQVKAIKMPDSRSIVVSWELPAAPGDSVSFDDTVGFAEIADAGSEIPEVFDVVVNIEEGDKEVVVWCVRKGDYETLWSRSTVICAADTKEMDVTVSTVSKHLSDAYAALPALR